MFPNEIFVKIFYFLSEDIDSLLNLQLVNSLFYEIVQFLFKLKTNDINKDNLPKYLMILFQSIHPNDKQSCLKVIFGKNIPKCYRVDYQIMNKSPVKPCAIVFCFSDNKFQCYDVKDVSPLCLTIGIPEPKVFGFHHDQFHNIVVNCDIHVVLTKLWLIFLQKRKMVFNDWIGYHCSIPSSLIGIND